MNIFALDNDPIKAAEAACDTHSIKMVLETAQLLSTAVLVHSPSAPGFYKSTHLNHPCSIWTRNNQSNFAWLIEHGLALSAEYTKRYGKVHKSEAVISRARLHGNMFCKSDLTPFAQAMPEQFRNADAIHAYKLYYAAAKFRIAKYRLNNQPTWWDGYRQYVKINNLEIENDKNDGIKEKHVIR